MEDVASALRNNEYSRERMRGSRVSVPNEVITRWMENMMSGLRVTLIWQSNTSEKAVPSLDGNADQLQMILERRKAMDTLSNKWFWTVRSVYKERFMVQRGKN